MATVQSIVISEETSRPRSEIAAPAATAWPLVLAFGFTLIFAGLLTSVFLFVLLGYPPMRPESGRLGVRRQGRSPVEDWRVKNHPDYSR